MLSEDTMSRISFCASTCFLLLSIGGFADEFDGLDGKRLNELLKQADASSQKSLNIKDLASMPFVVPGVRSSFLIIKTDAGNIAKLVISPGQRKATDPAREPAPIVILERAETYEVGNLGTRLAKVKDLVLFDGFQVDLDSGLVVPEGQGGDLVYRAGGEAGDRLETEGGASIVVFRKLIASKKSTSSGVSGGRSVLVGDFAGKYRLFADGQWSGTLKLEVVDHVVSGTYQSDVNGTSYSVEGEVSAEAPRQINFVIVYPRSRQEFSGGLFTDGKGALVGSGTMLGRPFRFFATREGGRITPADVDLQDRIAERKVAVELSLQGLKLDGKPIEEKPLVDALSLVMQGGQSSVLTLKVAKDVPFATIKQWIELFRSAGVGAIHLAPIDG